MLISPDFSEAKELPKDQPVPTGVYKARIEDCEAKTSKAGKPMLSWMLRIFGAEGDISSQNNRVLYYNTMTSGAGAGMLKTLIIAATGETPTSAFNTDDLLGKEIEITVQTKNDPATGELSKWSDIKAVKSASVPF